MYKGKHLKMLASWDFEGLYDVFNHFACGCGSESHDRQSTTDVSLQAFDTSNQSSVGLDLKEGSNAGTCLESLDTSNKR